MSRCAPTLTSFVGRRDELAAVRAALGQSRLVTLAGPGGVGKTRVATEFAEQVRRAFPDGVCLVELARLDRTTRRAALESALLEALAVTDQSNRSPAAKLRDHLRDRHLLLVVDNCEHVLAAVTAIVADLLAAAPSLHVLATSREALGVAGEHVRRLPPLAEPDAVALLVDRARAVDPAFAVTDANAAAVAALCHRLDGIPLAIELAATRLRSLSLHQVVERLDHRFALLNAGDRTALPRQQTLRALIDWSAELCTDAERLLWARLSSFPGAFELDAAEAVCGTAPLAPDQVLDVLDQLVAKSIVAVERDAERVRYRLLMIVREYGGELLDGYGERLALRRRHRDRQLERAARIVRDWAGPGQAAALEAMRREHADLIAALEFSATTDGEAEAGLELAALLRYHWLPGGSLAVGRRWLERLLGLTAGDTVDRGTALWVLAWVCLIQGDRDAAEVRVSQLQRTARALGDARLEAHVAHWSGLLAMFRGRLADAATLLERAMTAHAPGDDAAAADIARFMLVFVLAFADRLDESLEHSRRGLEVAAACGDRWSPTYLHWASAVCHYKRGERDQAAQEAQLALIAQRELGEPICIALTAELLAWLAAGDGHFERAAELAFAARGLMRAVGTSTLAFGPHLDADATACTRAFSARVADGRLAELQAQYAEVTREQVRELALGAPVAPPQSEPDLELTKRQLEIAALVAEGLTNREVAETLVLSHRTVDNHVARILAKLDFSSRSQVAAWVVARGVR